MSYFYGICTALTIPERIEAPKTRRHAGALVRAMRLNTRDRSRLAVTSLFYASAPHTQHAYTRNSTG